MYGQGRKSIYFPSFCVLVAIVKTEISAIRDAEIADGSDPHTDLHIAFAVLFAK